jgi:hypothetical protein
MTSPSMLGFVIVGGPPAPKPKVAVNYCKSLSESLALYLF